MKVTFRKTQIDGDGDPLVKSIVHFLATVASLLLLTGNVNAKAAAYSLDDGKRSSIFNSLINKRDYVNI